VRREDGDALVVLQSVRVCCSILGVAASGRPLGELAARSEFQVRRSNALMG
jgi:hypothetical protein